MSRGGIVCPEGCIPASVKRILKAETEKKVKVQKEQKISKAKTEKIAKVQKAKKEKMADLGSHGNHKPQGATKIS